MRILKTLTFLLLCLIVGQTMAQLPEGFARETILTGEDGLSLPVEYIPVDTNLAYIIQMDGTVLAMVDGTLISEPVIDIREECGYWGSNGLLGATIDPNFKENGYIYLLYNVDRHHYVYYGTPDYNPEASIAFEGGMGRITRFTIDTTTFLQSDPLSRHVLLGENPGEGIPIATDTHSTCALAFGDDGSLLASSGDGNTWICCYSGEGPLPSLAFDSICLADGVLTSPEMVGAFRSQFTDGLNGKIIRIHPETGDGLPNNPYYDESNPQANRSKWWATGFRNPFRMRVRPNSGWGNLEDGHPGTIYLADVGNADWEELNIITDGGGNYGWPIFEGMDLVTHVGNNGSYPTMLRDNILAENPLYGENGCEREYFHFQEVIQQQNEQHDYYFPNPCDPSQSIPENVLTFEHSRPAMSYRGFWTGQLSTKFPTYSPEGEATSTTIENMDGIDGTSFRGTSIIGGDFLRGEKIPEEYQNSYVFSDYTGWVKAITFDAPDEIKAIEDWQPEGGSPVDLTFNPYDGCLYITSLIPLSIDRICFGGNLRPIPITVNDTLYGTSPLSVDFNGSQSYDPEGGEITYNWNFGDGTSASGPVVSHEFSANGLESFTTVLTVTDSLGASNEKRIHISLNNTPPSVSIFGIEDGQLYSLSAPSSLELKAIVEDDENVPNEMIYEWSHLLRHNTHFHVLHEYDFMNGTTIVNPTGCAESDNYWYEINVTVTDPGGLSAFDSKFIYPDCDGELDDDDNNESDNEIVEVTIAPNPVDDLTTVLTDYQMHGTVAYRVYDPTGKLILNNSLFVHNNRKFFRINLQTLVTGVYILEVKYEERTDRIRFMKL